MNGGIGDHNEQWLENFIKQRLNLPDNWYALLQKAVTDAAVFTGSLVPGARTDTPDGYLPCDGAAVSRSTYAALWVFADASLTAGETLYDIGDGSSTFNVPDLQGRMAVMKGAHADVDTLGNTDGASLADRRPTHEHADAHTHSTPGGATDGPHHSGIGTPTTMDGSGSTIVTPWTGFYAAHTHVAPAGTSGARSTASTDAGGGSFVTVNWFVKV